MTGLGRAEQADEPEPDDTHDDPDYVPNPPYDLPAGASSWGEWMGAVETRPNTQEQS